MSLKAPDPRDEVQTLAQEAVARLSADLKAGRSQTLKDYLAAMGRFHKYSWTNAVLIHGQRPTATRVAGYHTWHDLGRFVRRGEKGIRIFAPLIAKGESDRATPSRSTERPGRCRRSLETA